MIPYLNHIVRIYMPLARDVNKEYHELFSFQHNELRSGRRTYNWRTPNEYSYGYVDGTYFELSKNY